MRLNSTPYAVRARRRATLERMRKLAFWSLAVAILAACVLDLDGGARVQADAVALGYPAEILDNGGPCYDCEGDPRFASELAR